MVTQEYIERLKQALGDYTPKHVDHPGAAPAAVLILVQNGVGDARVIFTERTNHVEHHKGQMSFPGGACDDCDDTPQSTALRETFEEIGVQPEHVKIIGQLDDMVTISNFRVTPFVGLLDHKQAVYPYAINDHEVSRVVEVPLPFLMDETNMELEVREHGGREVLVPAFTYDGHRIWGATARMLHQLIEIVR